MKEKTIPKTIISDICSGIISGCTFDIHTLTSKKTTMKEQINNKFPNNCIIIDGKVHALVTRKFNSFICNKCSLHEICYKSDYRLCVCIHNAPLNTYYEEL